MWGEEGILRWEGGRWTEGGPKVPVTDLCGIVCCLFACFDVNRRQISQFSLRKRANPKSLDPNARCPICWSFSPHDYESVV